MDKIAVMGDYDSIYGFAVLGLNIFPADDITEAARTLHKLAGSRHGIIFVTESLAAQMERDITRYQGQASPAIILIPGISENTGAGIAGVKASVEIAVGSDILFG